MNTKRLTMLLVIGAMLALFLTTPLSSAFAEALQRHNHHRIPRVPEIDPSIAISGLAMLSGGLLLIADRFRRRRR